jgi:phospholipid transport system substrate-binding protein
MMGLVLAGGVAAAPAQNPTYSRQDPSGLAGPAMVLREGVETLTGYLDAHRDFTPEQLRRFLEKEIGPYFDFQRMSYWAAGPLNRYFTAHQRQRFTDLFKQRFLGSMTRQLSSYRHTRLQYLRPLGNPLQGDVTLGVRVFSDNAYPVQIDFRLHRGQKGWKVYDVMANGSSAIAHYRNEFGMLARQYGIGGLLMRLGSKPDSDG